MTDLLQDLRYALRMFVKNPVFTAAAVVTLALGIGLNAASFSAVHALLLRPLPGVQEPERLVQLYRTWPGIEYGSNSIPHFRDLQERGEGLFEGVAAWSFQPVSLSTEGRSEIAMGQMVSANFFDVLGVEAARGRTFLPEESRGPGAHPVVVLSHGEWRSRFGGDPDVVGRTVSLNGRRFEVVGVAPEGFKGPVSIAAPALWAPLVMQPQLEPGAGSKMENRGSNFLSVLARTRPGTTVEQTRRGTETILAGLRDDHPEHYERSGIRVVPQEEAGIHPMFRDAQVGLSTVVMVVVGLLLLIACVNVANLFLARAADRRREMGIRLSLGAGRGRVVRQLLTESLLLAAVAGTAGLALAFGAVRVLSRVQLPTDMPVDIDVAVNGPVLLFTLVVAGVTGLLFGLVPALQASKPETVSALKGESGAAPGKERRVSRGLVVVQMALSVVLLLGAGIFLRNLQAATEIDVGFEAENLLLASVNPGLQGYDRARTESLYRELRERLESRPDVQAAAWAEVVPLGFSGQQTGVSVPGYEPGPEEQMSIDYNVVGPGYFQAMGISVLRGRGFTARDDTASAGVIVVNETMAERFWPGRDPVGEIVQTGSRERRVVGVVESGKYSRLGEEPLDYMYLPMAQVFQHSGTLHVRTSGDPAALAPEVRRLVRERDPALPVFDVRTMENHLGLAMLPARLAGGALGLFGLLGLTLAAVGIYGVTAYSVARRTREIGIRVALGAGRGRVVRTVLGSGVRLTLLGVAIGVATSLGVAGFLRDLLYTGRAVDPVAFVSVPLLLAAIALAATWLPARRAASVDPVRALRSE